jgi:hypothetical protein
VAVEHDGAGFAAAAAQELAKYGKQAGNESGHDLYPRDDAKGAATFRLANPS